MALLGSLMGLDALRAISSGDCAIKVGLIDGPVATDAPQFRSTACEIAPGHENRPSLEGAATRHGTFVASLLFARGPDGQDGLCPDCCALIAPILHDAPSGELVPGDQFALARALQVCVEAGASVINVSAGQRVASPEPDGILAAALAHCAKRDVLVIAATGNGGCACADLPAALPWAIAVGSHDAEGRPSRFSNFGPHYAANGLLAPGEAIAGLGPHGNAVTAEGTSYAAAIVTGVAALLLSAARKRGLTLSGDALRKALIESATPSARACPDEAVGNGLGGRLDITGVMARLGLGDEGGISAEGEGLMTVLGDGVGIAAATGSEAARMMIPPAAMRGPSRPAGGLWPSHCACGGKCGGEAGKCTCGDKKPHESGGCGCGGHAGAPQLVYALGTLDIDFGTEARRDAFLNAMPEGTSPFIPAQLADFLDANPVFEQGLTWVLRLDASPIYAIQPLGTYARDTADKLREIYRVFASDNPVEIVAVPGFMKGSVRLMSGATVPVIYPDMRGLYAWDVPALAQASKTRVAGPADPSTSLENFLNRVYYEFRNLGVTPQERALNYSATNAFQVSQVFGQALGNNMVLDSIRVDKSPICRPESDCWDVVLTFFRPENKSERAKMSYRFTVDVSDVLPVLVGPVRSWAVY